MENNYQELLLTDISFSNTLSINQFSDYKFYNNWDIVPLDFNSFKNENTDITQNFSNLEIYDSSLFNSVIHFNDNQLTNSKPIQVITPQKTIEKKNLVKVIKTEASIFEKKILKIINSDYYESGLISNIEKFMRTDCNSDNLPFIIEAAQQVLRKNLTNEHVVEGILTLLSTRSYEEMEPQGTFMCLSLLSNINYNIRDKAVQTYEKWNSKKGINDLLSVHFQEEWLQDYINKVIENLRKYGKD